MGGKSGGSHQHPGDSPWDRKTGKRAGGWGWWVLRRKPGWSRPDAPRSDLGLFKFSVLCQGDQLSCNLPPPVSPASTSTVADAYRWLNHTVGNRTVVEEGYYYLNNFDNILNSFGEYRKPRRAVAPTGPRCRGVQLAEASPSPGHVPRLLESSLAPTEPLICHPRAHSVARFSCICCPFPSIGEQQSFTLGWEGYSLMLGSHPPCHGGAQPQCPVPPRPGPHSSAPGFHGEAGRAGGHRGMGPCQTQLSQSIPS